MTLRFVRFVPSSDPSLKFSRKILPNLPICGFVSRVSPKIRDVDDLIVLGPVALEYKASQSGHASMLALSWGWV